MYYNRNYEYKQVNSAFIVIDEDYQRELDQNRVKRIVAKFNPDLVNPIKVSYRNGKYYVFDGQHTLAALKMRNGGSSDSMRTEILGGLALFCETYMGRYKRKILVNALSSVNPIVIVRDGKAFGNSLSGDKRFAVQILSHYNKRSRGEKLAAEF